MPNRTSVLLLLSFVPAAHAQSTKLSGSLAPNPGLQGGDVLQARFSPDSSRVVYLADQDTVDVNELYSVPADGSGPAVKLSGALTSDPSKDVGLYQVVGTRVLFLGGGAFFTVPLDGSAPAVQLQSAVQSFQVLPDGSAVVVVHGSSPVEVEVVPVDGSGPGVPLLTLLPGALGAYALTPDSQRLVYVESDTPNATWHLRSVLLDGSAAPVGLDARTGQIPEVLLSADSSRVVYRSQTVDFHLFSAPVDGSAAPVQLDLPLATSGVNGVKLSADSSRVVYTVVNGGQRRLFSVVSDGSANATLLNVPTPSSSVLDFQLTPDSTRVVFLADEATQSQFELYEVPIAGGSPTNLSGPLPPAGDVASFQVSPDSIGVVFRATKNSFDSTELFAVPFGGAPALIGGTTVEDGDVTDFTISPDDVSVVFRADHLTNGNFELFRVAIAGGTVRRLSGPLALLGDVTTVYVVSPDSTRVAYIADQEADNLNELFGAPILGVPAAVKLNPALAPGPRAGDVHGYRLTPDGATVVYVADGETFDVDELYRVPVGGGPVVKLSGPYVAGGKLLATDQWQITSDGVFVVYSATQDDPQMPELYGVPLDGSASAQKLSHAIVGSGSFDGVLGFELAPDGQRVVYRAHQNSTLASLWVTRVDGSATPLRLSLPTQTVSAFGFQPQHHVSPDGARVVYRAGPDLYSVPLDGSQPAVRITPAYAVDGGLDSLAVFAISADSRRVAYLADPLLDWRFEAFSVSIDGQDPDRGPLRLNAPLPPDGDVVELAIDPLGHRLVYAADQFVDSRFELFSAPLRGKRNAHESAGSGSTGRFRLNPPGSGAPGGTPRMQLESTGRFALFRQNNGGLYRSALDGGTPAEVLAPATTSFHLTEDGTGALWRAQSEGLFHSPLNGAPSVQLNVPRPPVGTPQSQLSTFGVDASNTWALWVADETVEQRFELLARRLDLSAPPTVLSAPLIAAGDVVLNASTVMPSFRFATAAGRAIYVADQDEDGVVELYSAPLP